jgi:hypothetical protein
MSSPENPYASPADAESDDPLPLSAHADTKINSIAMEFRRCVPWLMALVILLSLLAVFNSISALMFLRDLIGYGLTFLVIAGLYSLLAAVAWRLRAAMLELTRNPMESTLTEALVRTRLVYAFGSSMLFFASLILGVLVVVCVMSAISWSG